LKPADLPPDCLSLIMKGARLVPKSDSDAYWSYCASRVRMGDTGDTFGMVRDAIALFGPQQPYTVRKQRT
jgi:hypothetical protein